MKLSDNSVFIQVDLNILSGNALCNRIPVTGYRIWNGYGWCEICLAHTIWEEEAPRDLMTVIIGESLICPGRISTRTDH